MTKALYQTAKALLGKTKHLQETHLLQSGNLLKKIIISLFITLISYKNAEPRGLNFIMMLVFPWWLKIITLNTQGEDNGKSTIQQGNLKVAQQE